MTESNDCTPEWIANTTNLPLPFLLMILLASQWIQNMIRRTCHVLRHPVQWASLPGGSVEGCLCKGNYDAVTSRSAYKGCIQESLSSHLVTQFG